MPRMPRAGVLLRWPEDRARSSSGLKTACPVQQFADLAHQYVIVNGGEMGTLVAGDAACDVLPLHPLGHGVMNAPVHV